MTKILISNKAVVEMSRTRRQADIARELGVSRERIRQILNSRGAINDYWKNHLKSKINICTSCGITFENTGKSRTRCDDCLKYTRYKDGDTCRKCGKMLKSGHRSTDYCTGCYPRYADDQCLERGQKLKRKRLKLRISQIDVAKYMGLSHSMVSKYETGFIKDLSKYEDFLNCQQTLMEVS